MPAVETTLADVLSGGLPYAVGVASGQSRLVVPMREAGRVLGALIFTAAITSAWDARHVEAAQSLADLAASHIDLLRRSAFRAPPYVPGWRRTETAS
jgi:GAF domain-containing protein